MILILAVLLGQLSVFVSSSVEQACPHTEAFPEAGQSLMQVQRTSHVSKMNGVGVAQQELPTALYDLGRQTFGTVEALDNVVKESTSQEIKYAGVAIKLRFLAKDTAAVRTGAMSEDGSEYGLESLLETRQSDSSLVNMIDIGGNYGAVTIAVYNKYPELLRAVVVEPVPATYFFMRWNMWLNKVPYLTQEEFVKDPMKPGVVALHGGVTAENSQIQMCLHPEWSMNARAMNDHARQDGGDCDCSVMTCATVPGYGVQSVFDDYFGQNPVNLMKMDCEGCEFESLPFLAQHSSRVKRLVGELHVPDEDMIDTACMYDGGKYFTKVCRLAETEWAAGQALGCGQERKKCRW